MMTTRKIQTINQHGARVDAIVTYEDIDIKDVKLGDKVLSYNHMYNQVLSVNKINKKSIHGILFVWTDTELKGSTNYITIKVDGTSFRRIKEFKILLCDRCDNEGTFLYQDTTGEEERLCRTCVDDRERVDISDGKAPEPQPQPLSSKGALSLIKSAIDEWFYDQDEDKQEFVRNNITTLTELVLMTLEDAYENSLEHHDPEVRKQIRIVKQKILHAQTDESNLVALMKREPEHKGKFTTALIELKEKQRDLQWELEALTQE